jgi:hypothetical protein
MAIDTILPPARSHEERTKGSEANGIQCCSAAVLQSERGRRLEVRGERWEAGGRRLKAKCQMTNGNELVGCISLIDFIG